ncbi:hypothetical protein WN51_10119 [Melipona quadrifasciata]|uniref:Uncharacterized protein n=1 Tax=Melipona quadrifasciata TaxID=166423 RepID=A0A0N1IU07_9HYME|nr:hypothetical protein WN51_10119 [Melipona quadrifasciata]
MYMHKLRVVCRFPRAQAQMHRWWSKSGGGAVVEALAYSLGPLVRTIVLSLESALPFWQHQLRALQ